MQGDSGHSQTDMVTDVYSHIIDEDRKKNAELFEDAFYKKNKHGKNEVEGGVCVAHNQKQHGLFIPDGVQFHFIVLHQLPHLPDVKWG